MPRSIDIALLRAFVTVAETGGMTRAARALHLTQGAVSQQIRRLEEQFGHRLLERDRAGPRLTPTGERLLPRARSMLGLNDELWSLMTAPDFEGEIRFGVPHDIVSAYAPPILKAFHRARPRVRVEVVAETSVQLLERLAEGDLDVALTTDTDATPKGEVLIREPLVWAGARGGMAHTQDPLPLALGDERCAFRGPVLAAIETQGRDWRTVCSMSNMESLTAITSADVGIVALLRSGVPAGLDILGPGSSLPELPDVAISLHLPREIDPMTADFAEQVRDNFRDPAAAGAA